jgi:hypothetical protein
MLRRLASLSLLLLAVHAALIAEPGEDLHIHEEIELVMIAEVDPY